MRQTAQPTFNLHFYTENVYFCKLNEHRDMSLSTWIKTLPPRGKYTFTRVDLALQFPNVKPHTLHIAISREIKKQVIFSPWRGFYVIFPDEYKLSGIVPQTFYINELMTFLNKPYYVSLLNAAQHYGAAHQAPMSFFVMIEPPTMRDKITDKYKTHFIQKRSIPTKYLERTAVPTGWINYSSVELTAIDLITYRHNVGGLDRASTVLAELMEKTNFSKVDTDLLKTAPLASFQRLGFICETVLGKKRAANNIHKLILKGNEPMRIIPLKSNAPINNSPLNKRWKILENFDIEIDSV